MALDLDRIRPAEQPADPMFRHRWSPRAMSGAPIDPTALLTLFEAARWAPSAYNGQPWRFFYARRDTPHWIPFLSLLIEFNQGWAKQAGALVVIGSQRTLNGKPSATHSFDAGAAWSHLALQGSLMGLVVHGMAGYDPARARELLRLPDDLAIEAMVAIGHPAAADTLAEGLRARETPSGRHPLSELAREGGFV